MASGDEKRRNLAQETSEAIYVLGALAVEELRAAMIAEHGRPKVEAMLRGAVEALSTVLRDTVGRGPFMFTPGVADVPDLATVRSTVPPRLAELQAALDQAGLDDRVCGLVGDVLERLLGPTLVAEARSNAAAFLRGR